MLHNLTPSKEPQTNVINVTRCTAYVISLPAQNTNKGKFTGSQ